MLFAFFEVVPADKPLLTFFTLPFFSFGQSAFSLINIIFLIFKPAHNNHSVKIAERFAAPRF